MYAFFDRGSFPLLLNWTTSADPIFTTLIGGLNSFAGPAVGAVVLGLLRDLVTRNFLYFNAVLGVVLLVIILFLPGGIVEGVARIRARFGRSQAPPAPLDETADATAAATAGGRS
jgi:branched-chain amino acid transport system permease protein